MYDTKHPCSHTSGLEQSWFVASINAGSSLQVDLELKSVVLSLDLAARNVAARLRAMQPKRRNCPTQRLFFLLACIALGSGAASLAARS